MTPKLLLFVLLTTTTFSTQEGTFTEVASQQSNLLDELVLCRSCGKLVTFSRHVTDKRSPSASYTFNDTIFNKDEVVVQELPGDLFFIYPVVAFVDSTCSGVGEWEESSWFPGYISRPCVCSECGSYLGWVFQPIQPRKNSQTFFGFILSNLVGQSCNYYF